MSEDQEPQFKFRVCGTASLSINVEIEGVSPDDAECEVSMLDVSPDEEGVGCEYCAVSRFECNEIEKLHKVEADDDEPIYNFRAEGSLEVEVHLNVTAGSMAEALETVESMGWDFDDRATVLSCEQDGWDADDDPDADYNMHEKQWDDHMSKMERMKFLKRMGASDDRGYEIAGYEAYDVPPNWLCQLEGVV